MNTETLKIMKSEDITIFVGIDIHRKSWELQFLTANCFQKRIHLSEPSAEKLIRLIKSTYPNCDYKCVYEAGFSGFWLAQELLSAGIDCLVVHPADVPTTDKEKVFKDDPTDCRKLALSLRAGLLKSVFIPRRDQLVDRGLVRQRYQCKSNITRIKNPD